jgi:hypothetical protein
LNINKLDDLNNSEFSKLTDRLNSSVLCDIAFGAAYLGMSRDPKAVEPLLIKAITASDWLVQDFAVRALTFLEFNLPEAKHALDKIVLIKPPENGYVFEIKETKISPHVYLNFERGKLVFWGNGSHSDVCRGIFESLFKEVELFEKLYPNKPLIASFYLESFGDAIFNGLFTLFKRIQHHPDTIVYWHYNELGDDITCIGEDYESMVNLPFILLPVPDYESHLYF